MAGGEKLEKCEGVCKAFGHVWEYSKKIKKYDQKPVWQLIRDKWAKIQYLCCPVKKMFPIEADRSSLLNIHYFQHILKVFEAFYG